MKPKLKVEKLELENLINLLIELYESGIDYVDLSSDSTDPAQDKLIIQTRDSYINPSWPKGERTEYIREDREDDDDDDDDPQSSSKVEIRKLTDDDINNLLP